VRCKKNRVLVHMPFGHGKGINCGSKGITLGGYQRNSTGALEYPDLERNIFIFDWSGASTEAIQFQELSSKSRKASSVAENSSKDKNETTFFGKIKIFGGNRI
jgi:hypothetical protein